MNFPIYPYKGVGVLEFGMLRADIHEILGAPAWQKKSRFSDEIIEFWNDNGLQLVFSSPEDELIEVCLYPSLENVTLEDVEILSDTGKSMYWWLCRLDGAPRQTVGVTVLINLGIAITGFLNDEPDDKSVTVFARGRWREDDPALTPVKIA